MIQQRENRGIYLVSKGGFYSRRSFSDASEHQQIYEKQLEFQREKPS